MKLDDLGLPETEQKILEAAITVISEKGYSGATTSQIAKTAGVAEGTIFRYFKTKKDLLRGILIQMLNILGNPVILNGARKILLNTEQKDLRDILKALLCDRLQLFESIFPMARIIITEALYHEDIREALFQNVFAHAFEMFMSFRQQMVERGLIRSDIDPVAMARSIIGNVIILVISRKFFAEKFEPNDLDKELDQVIEVIMYGIAQP